MPIKRSIAAMLALLAAGCTELPSILGGPNHDELGGEPVQITRLQEHFPGFSSGITEPARLVVNSQTEWALVWRRMWQSHNPVPPAPVVDLSSETVLVTTMGGRPTGGYSIRVEEAAVVSGDLVIRVVETSPGRACVTTQAFTAPVDVVKVPRTGHSIRFETVKKVHDCG